MFLNAAGAKALSCGMLKEKPLRTRARSGPANKEAVVREGTIIERQFVFPRPGER